MAKRFEGSKEDERKDKAGAKKAGMSMKKFEGSAADKKMDRAGEKKMGRKR